MSHAKQRHNRQYFDDSMEIINRQGIPGHVKSKLCQQVNEAVVATTQLVIEQALEAELSAYVGAERSAHVPWGREAEQTRSGCYRRELITQYGCIADLRVPKLRKGNAALEWQTISRYQRCWLLTISPMPSPICSSGATKITPNAPRLSPRAAALRASSNTRYWRASRLPPSTPKRGLCMCTVW